MINKLQGAMILINDQSNLPCYVGQIEETIVYRIGGTLRRNLYPATLLAFFPIPPLKTNKDPLANCVGM